MRDVRGVRQCHFQGDRAGFIEIAMKSSCFGGFSNVDSGGFRGRGVLPWVYASRGWTRGAGAVPIRRAGGCFLRDAAPSSTSASWRPPAAGTCPSCPLEFVGTCRVRRARFLRPLSAAASRNANRPRNAMKMTLFGRNSTCDSGAPDGVSVWAKFEACLVRTKEVSSVSFRSAGGHSYLAIRQILERSRPRLEPVATPSLGSLVLPDDGASPVPPSRSLLIVLRAILVALPGRVGSCARSPSSWALEMPLASLGAGFRSPGGCIHAPGRRKPRETARRRSESRGCRARTTLPFGMQRAVVFSMGSEASRGAGEGGGRRGARSWSILVDRAGFALHSYALAARVVFCLAE